jgi:hypothetical protein
VESFRPSSRPQKCTSHLGIGLGPSPFAYFNCKDGGRGAALQEWSPLSRRPIYYHRLLLCRFFFRLRARFIFMASRRSSAFRSNSLRLGLSFIELRTETFAKSAFMDLTRASSCLSLLMSSPPAIRSRLIGRSRSLPCFRLGKGSWSFPNGR